VDGFELIEVQKPGVGLFLDLSDTAHGALLQKAIIIHYII
jgi:hypothetical protein